MNEEEKPLWGSLSRRVDDLYASLEELRGQIWCSSGLRERVMVLEFSVTEFQKQMARYEERQKEIIRNSEETLESLRELKFSTRAFEEHIKATSTVMESLGDLRSTTRSFKEQFDSMNDWRKWLSRLVIAALVPSILSFVFLVSVKVYNDIHRPPDNTGIR